ncbi:MAG: sulfatase-like hydrolase/transferase [Verrucomicrobiota bacterium]
MKSKKEIVENWLPRYTDTSLEQFGEYILLTNFPGYIEMFSDRFDVRIHGEDKPMQSATANNITIINFGMGSAMAATIMDLLSAIKPKAVLFLGKCGALKKKIKLGNIIKGIACSLLLLGTAVAQPKPNVVLIVCDDLNDYITGIPGQAGHPQAKTPHVERLARSGVAFRRAYCNSPICAPSRSSFLTGIHPRTSGNFGFREWYKNPVLRNSKTVMEHFRDNGYHVAGSGKLMHHAKQDEWSEFAHGTDYGPVAHDGEKKVPNPAVPELYTSKIGFLDGSFGSLADVPFGGKGKGGWAYGTWGKKIKPFRYKSETDRDPTPDERNARWAAGKLEAFANKKGDKPFFLAVGFVRPHTPLHAPQKYFDQYPLEDLQLPLIKENDAADCHLLENSSTNSKGFKAFRTLGEAYPGEEGLKKYTQAYLACVASVDDCVGQVVDAVDNSPFRDNTIIVLTSDHGMNLGEKDFLFKNSPWEESTRVPLVIRIPGMAKAGGIAEHPVSLVDLYPTLADLCGLEGDTRKNEKGARLDGHSLRPFLEDPESDKWKGPNAAVTVVGKDHWSVRTRRWRYIRYKNGAEELYDHDDDPNEWTNLAGNPDFAEQKQTLHRQNRQRR